MKLLIDNGHGDNTPGKCSPAASLGQIYSKYYLKEYAWTRTEACRVADLLMFDGFDVELLVPEVWDVPLATRTARVNEWCRKLGAENVLCISIHVNAAKSDHQWHDARGWCAFTSPGKTKADLLATEMYNVALEEFYDPNREYAQTFYFGGKQKPVRCDWSDGDPDQEAKFWMLTKTNCPTVLVENFFQDNKEDVLYLRSLKGQGSCAHVITQGISNYFDKYHLTK